MQRLTFDLIGSRAPITESDSEIVRIRLSDIGFINPSIILKTDDTVNVSIDKYIYTISSNLTIKNEENIVSETATITLLQNNHGIQELLVNAETIGNPGYVEITNYTVLDNIITLDSAEYNGKEAFIKYLTTK